MKHKIAELEGALLDAAVAKAKAEGFELLNYSTDWQLGGPIIERQRISLLLPYGRSEWFANGYRPADWGKPLVDGFGPTPLIAAMRCYVASKFGEEVELP